MNYRPAGRLDHPHRVQLSLIGGFELTVGSRSVPVRPSCRRLLAYLAVHDQRIRRRVVAGALWPDSPAPKAAASLRSTISRLSRTGDVALLRCKADTVALDPEVGVDIRLLESHPPGPAAVRELSEDVLPDWPDDWLVAVREWHRQVRLHRLESLSTDHLRRGRYYDALRMAMAVVASEPLRESGHCQVIRIHLAEGNVAEAIRQYQMYRHLLYRELGVAPSPRLRGLLAPFLGRPLDSVRARPPSVGRAGLEPATEGL
jgi:DNA-binding SARP family transcriptional activator